MRALIIAAGILGFLLVLAAAGGAHLVVAEVRAADPDSRLLRQWDRAILFGLVHTLGALVCAAVAEGSRRLKLVSGWAFVGGVVLFSGVQVARIAGANLPGVLVPIGGLSFLAGWLLLAASAAAAKR